jgi:hypothetical protein
MILPATWITDSDTTLLTVTNPAELDKILYG